MIDIIMISYIRLRITPYLYIIYYIIILINA